VFFLANHARFVSAFVLDAWISPLRREACFAGEKRRRATALHIDRAALDCVWMHVTL
jgi:hypothetical protein